MINSAIVPLEHASIDTSIINGNVKQIVPSNQVNDQVKKDLPVLNPSWADLVEEEQGSKSPTPSLKKNVENEGNFDVALSKSKKKKLRRQRKKACQTAAYNTRSRAGSDSIAQ